MGLGKRWAYALLLWPALASTAALPRAEPEDARVAQALARESHDPEAARRDLAELLPQMAPGASQRNAMAHLCELTVDKDARSSLPMVRQGLLQARQAGDKGAESRFLHCRGYAEESLGDMAAATRDYAAAVELGQASGDREALAQALASRGELRQSSGEFSGAINDLKRAYDLFRALGQPYNQGNVLNAMANLYSDPSVGEYDKAIAYYRQLLVEYEKGGNRADVATIDFNIASSLELKGDLDAAMTYYRRPLRSIRRAAMPARSPPSSRASACCSASRARPASWA